MSSADVLQLHRFEVISSDPMALNVASPSLRSWLQNGGRAGLAEWLHWLAPLCRLLAERHARGEVFRVHPSVLMFGNQGLALGEAAVDLPILPEDRATVAPELQGTLEPGDAKGSVYAIAAILYEGLTREPYRPNGPSPRALDAGLPDALDPLLARALVADRAHRPADLNALADAMVALMPRHPSSLDIEIDVAVSMLPPKPIEVDIAVSMLPPPPVENVPSRDPFQLIVNRAVPPPAASSRSAKDELLALKTKLEGNRAPQYVVSKNHIDHGPFTAVELLQQIASRSFLGTDVLRDSESGRTGPIVEFSDFAPFVEQAMLGMQLQRERAELVTAARADARGGATKAVLGSIALAAIAVTIGIWFVKQRGLAQEKVSVASDRTGSIEVAGLGSAKRSPNRARGGPGGGPGGTGAGAGGGHVGGGSFESALDNNNDEMVMGAAQTPDLTKDQLAGPLRSVSFISACGAPDDMKVTVRVAVKNGRAIGVTASTSPPSAGVAGCIEGRVRGLGWPASSKADFVTMSY